MRKTLAYILTTLITIYCFASCSPQKRLNRFLKHHPELQRESVIKIDTFFVQDKEQSSTNFTINDLIALADSAAQQNANATIPKTDPESVKKSNQSAKICAETTGSSASITANADGSYNLNLLQKPDTIFVHDSIQIPAYLTETEYVDRPVYQMTKWQSFNYQIGLALFIIIVATIIVSIGKLILRHFNIK